MGTLEETTIEALSTLDWSPELPCESRLHPTDHAAEFAVRFTCGCMPLLCAKITRRAIDRESAGIKSECLACGGASPSLVSVVAL